MHLVTAATDGSAINNPNGPAGWAWFVGEDCWAAGGFTKASNQVAELFAILALLRAVPREHDLLIRTDSQFAINVCTKWMRGWKAKGWRKADGQPVANLELIQDLDRALTGRSVRMEWVRGHNGDAMNEIADRICTAASRAIGEGQPVVRGPGWTGHNPNPVIPAAPKPARRAEPTRAARAASSTGASDRGRELNRDLHSGGWGANATVRRVSAKVPSSPDRGKPVVCPSCDGPIHPISLECRCSR